MLLTTWDCGARSAPHHRLLLSSAVLLCARLDVESIIQMIFYKLHVALKREKVAWLGLQKGIIPMSVFRT